MDNFTYQYLKDLLEIGHEIEFDFGGIFCSINNGQNENHKASWYFSTNHKGEFTNTFLADFYDVESLLNSLDKIKIKEKSLEEIIDQTLYDPSSLTIF
ncbi:hypothetical protein ABLW17_05655 [Anaerococcus murdochii]|uniref:hypothetical protein n=1 Tax=Anaerococcus murdochii TaxID=411577 RepID=UPI0032B57C82